MFNIIKSDLFRIFKGKAIYITLIVMFIFMFLSIVELQPGSIGISLNIVGDSESYELSKDDENLYLEADSILEERKILKNYPYKLDKAIVGANANLYYLFIVIVVIVISTDLSNSTSKNTLSFASRKKYYFSKLICAILLCTSLVLINNFGTYIFNILINGKSFSSSLSEIVSVTLYQLPMMYGIISLLVCIASVVKKNSIFNTVTIPFLMIVQVIIMAVINLFKINPNIMNYEYQYVLSSVSNNPTNTYIIQCLLLGIAYIVVFNFIGYYSLKKAEIK